MYDDSVPTNGKIDHPHRPAWMNPLDRERIESIQGRARDLNERVVAFVRENPVQTVAGAVVVGYLLGRLIRW
jgi:hypothetical protein